MPVVVAYFVYFLIDSYVGNGLHVPACCCHCCPRVGDDDDCDCYDTSVPVKTEDRRPLLLWLVADDVNHTQEEETHRLSPEASDCGVEKETVAGEGFPVLAAGDDDEGVDADGADLCYFQSPVSATCSF